MPIPTVNDSVPNLLRQDQVEDTVSEIGRLKNMLTQPGLQNPGFARQQLRALEKTLNEFTPQPFEGRELDEAARREAELREEIVADGMPTSAEMRKNPPGAVHKHRTFEARNRKKIALWKYLRKRLFAGSGDPDVSNLERYRPRGGAGELSMDGAQIPGKTIILPDANPTPGAVMSDAESRRLNQIDPELHAMMAALSGPQRAEVLDKVRKVIKAETAPKRTLSPEHKAKLAEGRKRAAEEAKAANAE